MLDHRSHSPKIPRFGAGNRPFIPNPPASPTDPRWSITVDDSLRGSVYAWSVVGHDQLLLRVRYQVSYDELAWSYAENLPSWAKRRIFGGLQVIDPTVSLDGYLATRWWGPEAAATHDAATSVEALLGLVPWQHDWLVN